MVIDHMKRHHGITKKRWGELQNETKLMLFQDSLELIKIDLIRKHGTWRGYMNYRIKKRGFESRREYEDHLAKKRGFENCMDVMNHKAKERGFKNHYELRKHQLKQQGFNNATEYKKFLKERKAKQ